MYPGYLTLDGTEVLNGARVQKYITTLLPQLDVECDYAALRTALGAAAYTTPAADNAPWYDSGQAPTGRFYGFMPLGLLGADDSTRELQSTELVGDGAVAALPRHGSREIHVETLALGADEEALRAGISWLKDVLENGCGQGMAGKCLDRKATFLAALPVSKTTSQLLRSFYRVELLEAPKRTKDWPSKTGAMATVTFVLKAHIPWAFTEATRVGVLNMDTGTITQTDAAGEDCSAAANPYNAFINDPYFTAIKKPPAAPNIKPPNILTVASWRRRYLALPHSETTRAGRAVPVVTVAVGSNDLQQVRIRFYDSAKPWTGCEYAGEFMISYLPVNSVMTIDGIRREASVLLSNGATVPGGHLIYGSDGKPFLWPDLSCHKDYTMVVDMMPGNTGITATLDLYVRD